MSEQQFRDWLESIKFVDAEGREVPSVLEPDESIDYDFDRESDDF